MSLSRPSLRQRLEQERDRLYHAVQDAASLHDPEVVRQSRRVDRLIQELMSAGLETAAAEERAAGRQRRCR